MALPPPPTADDGQDGIPADKRQLGMHVLRLLEETHRNSTEAVARVRWICDALAQHGVPAPRFDVRKLKRDVDAGAAMFRTVRDAFFGTPPRRR